MLKLKQLYEVSVRYTTYELPRGSSLEKTV
jgi:hypothetical protein